MLLGARALLGARGLTTRSKDAFFWGVHLFDNLLSVEGVKRP